MRFGVRNPSETVHIRAQALTDTQPPLDYRAAMAVVLRDGAQGRLCGACEL